MKAIYLTFLLVFSSILLFGQLGMITVISPNGGENWSIGNTYPITWNSTGLTGEVRIDLSSPLMTFAPTTIAVVPITDGVYNWTIPASVLPASFYRISITWVTILAVWINDTSDADFTISNTTGTQSITVISPNGGENWQIGSTHPITWSSTGLTGNVRIDLISPLMNPLSNLIGTAPIADGVFNWTIPTTVMPASFYRVAINWISNLPVAIGDASDADFTISNGSGAPAITVISPNGGEHWFKGTTHQITWSSENLTGNVQIVLVGANTSITTTSIIAMDIPNTGIFNWLIPQTIPVGSMYKIMLRSRVNNSIFDLSNAPFSIIDNNTSRIRVISPNGGENWLRGSIHQIRWSYVSPSTTARVEIALFRGGPSTQLPFIIAPSVPNTGIFIWAIPTTIPTGRYYKIRIRALNTANIVDFSDNYFAVIANTILIRSISPNINGKVTINLESDESVPATVSVFNIKGQHIRTLISNEVPDGKSALVWDGYNSTGRHVRNGIYLLRVQSGTTEQTRKFTY